MPEKLPKWVAEEITNAKWESLDSFKATGYFLDINPKNKTADVQLYDPSPEGRYILNVDVLNNIVIDELKRGEVYSFEIKTYKSVLSDKVKKFLTEEYQVAMDDIFKYEMITADLLEDVAQPAPQQDTDIAEE
jgi:hypothetical protein